MKRPRLDDVRAKWRDVALALNTMPVSEAAKVVAEIRRELTFWRDSEKAKG